MPGDQPPPDTIIDLAHERLIDGWPTFREWVSTRRKDELLRRRLEERAAAWAQRGRAGGLLDDVELREARDWQARARDGGLGESEDVHGLIERSATALAARRRVGIGVAGVLGAALVVLWVNADATARHPIHRLAFSPDGRYLAISAVDEAPRFLALDPADQTATAREIAGRELTNEERERFGLTKDR